jgi:hypothetical protein
VAMPRPMPRVEPVTRAIFPWSMIYSPPFLVDASSMDLMVFV